MKIEIQSGEPGAERLAELRGLFLSRWNELDPFEGNHPGFTVPAPIVALADGELIGGLAFTSAPLPGTDKLELWINAVLVLPDYRRRGIATRLIDAAMVRATETADSLYAFTDVPGLYRNLGWELVSTTEANSIFHTTIVRQ